MASMASRALLPPVMASQMPETEGRNNLLDSVGGVGDWWLKILEGIMLVNKCELEWVLNGDEGECVE